MGAGKTTFMITDSRPKGTPYAPTHLSESHHRRLPCGAFDSVVGGREGGGLPMELYLLQPVNCLCYQKLPPPAFLCPSSTLSKASARASVAPSLSLHSLQPPRESFHRFSFRHSKKRYGLGVTSLAFTRPDRKALPAYSPPCF